MFKKFFLLSSFIIGMLFSSCSMVDELKALAIYSDFLFAFQDHWEENSSSLIPIPLIDGDIPNSLIYLIPITAEDPIIGKLKNEYSGMVYLVFYTYADADGVDEEYINFTVDLDVKSAASTPVGQTETLKLDLTAFQNGLILDGDCKVSGEIEDSVTLYRQVANLEGLWVKFAKPAAK